MSYSPSGQPRAIGNDLTGSRPATEEEEGRGIRKREPESMKYTKYDILYCPVCRRSERFVIHALFAECEACNKKLARVHRTYGAATTPIRRLPKAI
jgi:hypothetical protein